MLRRCVSDGITEMRWRVSESAGVGRGKCGGVAVWMRVKSGRGGSLMNDGAVAERVMMADDGAEVDRKDEDDE
jgi:hypothetical protein